jgi:hypothetical protein
MAVDIGTPGSTNQEKDRFVLLGGIRTYSQNWQMQ